MDVRPAFVADGQPSIAIEPGERPLDDPAMADEPFARLDALAGDADLDVPLRERLPAARNVVCLVGVAFGGPLASAAVGLLDRRDRIKQVLEDDRLVAVGSGQERGEREAAAVDHQVALRPRFAAIRWIRPDRVAPLLAGMLALSSDARLQSMRSASPSRSSRTWCSRSHTPAACQSRRRRQPVMPLPHPSSWGNISHGMPLFKTKMMPVKQARSGTRGRPPLGLGGSRGRSGATTAHRSSLT